MKNEEIWSHYKDYTRDITEFSRKLGFAGAALCWTLKQGNVFPFNASIALILFVAYFIMDVSQGLVAAVVLRSWIHRQETSHFQETGSIDGEYEKPRWLDYPAFILFLVKECFLLAGFVFVGLGVWPN